MRAKLVIRYVLGEMIPTFFIGVIVFVFILLMFQALRLTEFVLIHGVQVTTIVQMMGYLSTSFLPILFPMSLLFTVLLTYSRLSADSEIVALRAIGLHTTSILAPAVILSVLIGVLSLQTSFHIAPWGNRQFETLITTVGAGRPTAVLREGTFSEGFFDLVIYANKVDSEAGKLEQVFIFDEQDEKNPITVIANQGRLMFDKGKDPLRPQNRASLRLIDGSVHRTTPSGHTKIGFDTYDIFLSDPLKAQTRSKSPPSLTIEELNKEIKKAERSLEKKKKPKDKEKELEKVLELKTEFHKRTALAFACVIFALIGAGIGTVTNRRNVKSGGTVICLALIISYYIMYVVCEGASRNGTIQPMYAMWLTNALFSIAAIFAVRGAWR